MHTSLQGAPIKGKGKGGGSQSMVNFWSTGTSADYRSGSQQADAPRLAFTARRLQAAEALTETSPPWLSEDLLFEHPLTSSLGYAQTLYSASSHDVLCMHCFAVNEWTQRAMCRSLHTAHCTHYVLDTRYILYYTHDAPFMICTCIGMHAY